MQQLYFILLESPLELWGNDVVQEYVGKGDSLLARLISLRSSFEDLSQEKMMLSAIVLRRCSINVYFERCFKNMK